MGSIRKLNIKDYLSDDDCDRMGLEHAIDTIALLKSNDPRIPEYMDLFTTSMVNLHNRGIPTNVLDEYRKLYARVLTIGYELDYLTNQKRDTKKT